MGRIAQVQPCDCSVMRCPIFTTAQGERVEEEEGVEKDEGELEGSSSRAEHVGDVAVVWIQAHQPHYARRASCLQYSISLCALFVWP
jgi:hypothetical protein